MNTQITPSYQNIIKDDWIVGRQSETSVFYENIAANNPEHSIFVITGPGGIGKTTILNRFETLGKAEGCLIGKCDSETDPINAIGILIKQFKDQGYPLKDVSKTYDTYIKNKNKIINDPDIPKGALEVFVGTATKITVGTIKQTPGAGIALSALDENVAAELTSSLVNYLRKKFNHSQDELNLMISPVQTLSEKLVIEFNKAAIKRKLIFLFDSFEKSHGVFEIWLRSLLFGDFGNLNIKIIFAISGRHSLGREWISISDRSRRVFSTKLSPFDKVDTFSFLNKKQVFNNELCESYYKLAKGIPVLLSLLVSKAQEFEHESPDISDDIVKYFLEKETQLHRETSLLCSVPLKFNRDVLAVILDTSEQEISSAFEWICNQSFVHKKTDGFWYYHDWVRELFLINQHDTTPDKTRETHRKLEGYYRNLRDQVKIIGDTPLRNGRWLNFETQRFYHYLSSSVDIDISEAINSSLTVFHQNFSHFSAWADNLQQVANEIKDNDLKKWAQLLLGLADSWSAADWNGSIKNISRLMEFQELTPENKALAYFSRGFSLSNLGQHEKAFIDYDEAIQLDSNNSIAIARRARVYAMRGDTDKALQDFDLSIKKNNSCAWTFATRGFIYGNAKNLNLALADLTKAIDLDSNYCWALTQRAKIYEEMKEYDLALADWAHAIEVNPNHIGARAFRGEFYRIRGAYDLSLKDFDVALSFINPKLPLTSWLLASRGEVHRVLGHFAQAIKDLSYSNELRKDNVWTMSRLGTAYGQNREYDKAKEILDRVVEISPNNDWALAWRGELCRQIGEIENAVVYFSKAIDQNEKRARSDKDRFSWAYKQRGITFEMLGKFQEALNDLNKALILEPTYDLKDKIRLISANLAKNVENPVSG